MCFVYLKKCFLLLSFLPFFFFLVSLCKDFQQRQIFLNQNREGELILNKHGKLDEKIEIKVD